MLDDTTNYIDDSVPTAAAVPDECSFAGNLDAYDLQAEREAAAITWFAEEVGMPEQPPLFVKRRRQQIVYVHCRYPMAASLRFTNKLQRATVAQLVNWSVTAKFDRNFCTAKDRARRALNKDRRLLLARQIQTCGEKLIPFRFAMKLGQVSQRAMHRAIQRGIVLRTIQNGQVMVDVASFRDYTAKRRIYAKES